MAASTMSSEDLNSIYIEFNNMTYEITVSSETLNSITTDPGFAYTYMAQQEAAGHLVPVSIVNCDESRGPTHNDSDMISPTECLGLALKEDSSKVTWTDKMTTLLITTRLDHDDKFMNPVKKINKIWDDVARIMRETTNSPLFTGTSVSNKWKNLIATYKKIILKNGKTGESSTTWPYFIILNDALGTRANIKPSDELIGSSFSSESDFSSQILTPDTSLKPSPSSSDEDVKGGEGTSSNQNTPKINKFKAVRKSFLNSKQVGESELVRLRKGLLEEKMKRYDQKEKQWKEKMDLEKARNETLKELCQVLNNISKTPGKK